MKRHLNTLFVTTAGSYLAKEGQAIAVKRGGETALRVPILAVDGIVCMGAASVSTALLGLCGAKGVTVSFLSPNGRFLARVEGPVSGNVLLRKSQFAAALDPAGCLELARGFVLGKVINARTTILRAIRDHDDPEGSLGAAAEALGRCVRGAETSTSLDRMRGIEGEAGRTYFSVFDDLITRDSGDFRFRGRARRPPTDPINAMLSFAYAILAHDVRSACEATGLDPQVGFLHRDRPGRPGLALDLMEELRAPLADRAVLTLVNRRQVSPKDFDTLPGGAVRMRDSARKSLLVTYQKRKQEEVMHPFLRERTTIGLIPHLQARLLARYLRGDLDGYPPYLVK